MERGKREIRLVLDAEGPATEAMQAIAREFNISETVFVLRPATQHTRATCEPLRSPAERLCRPSKGRRRHSACR